MTRYCGIAVIVLLTGATASAADVREFTVEVNANGIKVESKDLSISAMRASFDAAKGRLLFEGSSSSPVTLTQLGTMGANRVTAQRVVMSLKDGMIRFDGILQLKSVLPAAK